MVDYYSDRENGPKARTEQIVLPVVWAGLVSRVQSLINDGSFGYSFPQRCLDGQVVCGANEDAIGQAVQAEMPGLMWPLITMHEVGAGFYSENQPYAPPTPLLLDFLEFVHRSIAKPILGKYHDFRSHHHLTFDVDTGRTEFRADVNRIFTRNNVAYEITSSGQIVRTFSPILDAKLHGAFFQTGDQTLDDLLEQSRKKFSSRDASIRREALERLWDAWERLKSLARNDKRESIKVILDRAASEPNFRKLLETEARCLTDAGNNLQIRHYEFDRVPVSDADHVDYLFYRMFVMVELLIQKNRGIVSY